MRRTTVSRALFVLFLLIISLLAFSVVKADTPPPGLVDDLRAKTGGNVKISYHNGTGKVRFIGTDRSHAIAVKGINGEGAKNGAEAFLAKYGSVFGLGNPSEELAIHSSKVAVGGQTAFRYQQIYKSVPVLGGELIVQVEPKQTVLSASGEILPGINMDVQPILTSVMAEQSALETVAKANSIALDELIASDAELWIYNPVLLGGPGARITSLVWRVEVKSKDLLPIRELVLVDANRGGVLIHFNQIESALSRSIYDNNNNISLGLPGNGPVRIEGQSAVGITDVDNAYDYAGDVYDFYWNTHTRDSINGLGMALISTTRYCDLYYGCPMENAFWSGTQMVYGDGYASADDVVGHEMTHGVTDYESGLFYYYQSGAINESFSDLWGEFIDQTNGAGDDSDPVRWLMGEDLSIGEIRSMKDPTLFYDPDKMTSGYYYLGRGDNGGVHYNSGVNNKAVYLMVEGDSFNGHTVTGLGLTKVAKLYYEVQTNLLTSGADYADLYDSLIQACTNLTGTAVTSEDCVQVQAAIDAVEMNMQPVADYNTDAPLCSAGQSTTNSFFDDMESGSGNWTFGASIGTNRWSYDSPYGKYAHSGDHYLYADDYPSVVADTFASMRSDVQIPSDAFLHFYHAYGFQSSYDGGVVEYSTNGGSTWTDSAALFLTNGYDDTIVSGFSNPLSGRVAFTSDSHGYISSKLDLSSLAGQNVRFRWRMGLNTSGYVWGWWLDDVQIFTCQTTPTYSYSIFLPAVMKNFNSAQVIRLQSPVNGATSVVLLPNFSWNVGTQPSGTETCIALGQMPAPTVLAYCSTATSGVVQYQPPASLLPNETYYWRIAKILNGDYAHPIWTEIWSFTTTS